MKYGVTKKGFRRKTYQEILDEKIDLAKEEFGVNIDTSETSILGTLIRNSAWDEAEQWELAEEVYLSAFVNYSEGTSLDNVGDYIIVSRNPATKSKGIGIFKGSPGTVIPKNFKIKTENEIVFETTKERAIKENGEVEIPIESLNLGKEFNMNEGVINTVVNPIGGLDEVTNYKTQGGRDMETDAEFRERYHRSYSRGGGATADAIRAALLDLDEVTDADVIENVTMETVNGIPPKSVHSIVHGGLDDVIASTILKSKAGGIQAFGKTYIDVNDDKGRTHKIGFTRAEKQDIYVRLKLLKGSDYKGDNVVKRAVINYIGGKDRDNIEYKGLGLGKDVIVSKIAGAVICLGGIEDISVEISKNNVNYQDKNIAIGEFEVAVTDMDKVVVEYV